MSASPCLAHGCAACCYATETLVSEADVRRLEGAGHRREDFVVVGADGLAGLRNVTGGDGRERCVFLKDDRCSVYADRPEGCRAYPLTLAEGSLRVMRDPDCPWRQEFPLDPAAGRRLRVLVATVLREGRKRA